MKPVTKSTLFLAVMLLLFHSSFAACNRDSVKEKTAAIQPDADNAGLKMPSGFSALLVASNLGTARHLAVTPEGDLYVKMDGNVNGKGIIYLHDDNKDGRAETVTGFGDYGGTGILIKNGYLYASSDNDVYRYKLDANNKVSNGASPEKIVTGLINHHQHNSKSLALDNSGNLYVNIGAPSNICAQRGNDKLGQMPCPLLDSTGGIWMFKADKPNQTYADGVRYTTGLRNVVGLDWNNITNTLFVMQHGRDALSSTFPDLYTTKQSAELPAECMYELHNGDNAGWPYMYYDQIQKKKIVCPEYGGDGKKEADSKYINPVAAYPGHMAPDGLLFYTGNMFPEKYKNGAFIAFHGSWNRAPEPQKGYFVVFQPFKDGKPNGDWEIFADNFAGGADFMQPGSAKHRPCGLAQGADGSLYVTDDSGGNIYRIMYSK